MGNGENAGYNLLLVILFWVTEIRQVRIYYSDFILGSVDNAGYDLLTWFFSDNRDNAGYNLLTWFFSDNGDNAGYNLLPWFYFG